MAVKLHRCSFTWVKIGHACHNVQKALDSAGVEYEVVAGPYLNGKRTVVKELTGQHLYPVIEFEDGSWYHEHSKKMVATIAAGELDEQRGVSRAPAPGT
jgi:hypothetical protein